MERLALGGEQRDRIRDEVRRDERHDADHRKAAVLELGGALASERLLRERLGEAKRVPEERDLARGAARHVVRLDRRLAEELQDANDAKDLELAVGRRRLAVVGAADVAEAADVVEAAAEALG